ncbi:unnamed protein product [Amoebophrya sp. A25]|nr:unnamed protein product [Amoebophrya sp. A25]|eukprot:GSA25T00018466001.1
MDVDDDDEAKMLPPPAPPASSDELVGIGVERMKDLLRIAYGKYRDIEGKHLDDADHLLDQIQDDRNTTAGAFSKKEVLRLVGVQEREIGRVVSHLYRTDIDSAGGQSSMGDRDTTALQLQKIMGRLGATASSQALFSFQQSRKSHDRLLDDDYARLQRHYHAAYISRLETEKAGGPSFIVGDKSHRLTPERHLKRMQTAELLRIYNEKLSHVLRTRRAQVKIQTAYLAEKLLGDVSWLGAAGQPSGGTLPKLRYGGLVAEYYGTLRVVFHVAERFDEKLLQQWVTSWIVKKIGDIRKTVPTITAGRTKGASAAVGTVIVREDSGAETSDTAADDSTDHQAGTDVDGKKDDADSASSPSIQQNKKKKSPTSKKSPKNKKKGAGKGGPKSRQQGAAGALAITGDIGAEIRENMQEPFRMLRTEQRVVEICRGLKEVSLYFLFPTEEDAELVAARIGRSQDELGIHAPAIATRIGVTEVFSLQLLTDRHPWWSPVIGDTFRSGWLPGVCPKRKRRSFAYHTGLGLSTWRVATVEFMGWIRAKGDHDDAVGRMRLRRHRALAEFEPTSRVHAVLVSPQTGAPEPFIDLLRQGAPMTVDRFLRVVSLVRGLRRWIQRGYHKHKDKFSVQREITNIVQAWRICKAKPHILLRKREAEGIARSIFRSVDAVSSSSEELSEEEGEDHGSLRPSPPPRRSSSANKTGTSTSSEEEASPSPLGATKKAASNKADNNDDNNNDEDDDKSPEPSLEAVRIDPGDGQKYTFKEVVEFYKGQATHKEILDYWYDTMTEK